MRSPEEANVSAISVANEPVAEQIVHQGTVYTTVQEGLASILVPPHTPPLTDPKAVNNGILPPAQSVFYNPIQQFNRDLTVLAIRVFGEEYTAESRDVLQSKKHRARKRQKNKIDVEKHAEGADVNTLAKGAREGNQGHNTAAAVTPAKGARPRGLDATLIEDQDSRPFKRPRLPSNGEKISPVGQGEPTTAAMVVEDIPDEDLIACESSMPQPATCEQVADGHGPTEQSKTQSEPEVKFEILDAFSASGLRALRYAHELPFVTSVTANDLSPKAVQAIKRNIDHNRLNGKVKATVGNANAHMYQTTNQDESGTPRKQYSVIDLDPYGTAVPFLDAAVQAVVDGGLLCVTCTDTAVFNSVGYLEKTFALYGGLPIKGPHAHEGGLRLILHAITAAAAKYGRSVEPLLSLSIDYYARIFVRVRRSPNEVKLLAGKTMMVYGCDAGCGAWRTQFIARNAKQFAKNGTSYYKFTAAQGPVSSPHCEHCGFKTHLAGPLYGGPLHNPDFIRRMLSHLPNMDVKVYGTVERLQGMLCTALDEAVLYQGVKNDTDENGPEESDSSPIQRLDPAMVDNHPFYVAPSALARVLHCQAPSMAQLRGALRYRGYRVGASHAKPGTIKTDAPWSEIWKIMLEWVRKHSPIHPGRVKEGMAGWQILQGLGSATSGNPSHLSHTAQTVNEAGTETTVPATAGRKISEDAAEEKPWVVFDEKLGEDKARGKIVRYQANPRANWGPMARAKGIP